MAQCLNYVWFWTNQFEYLCRIIDHLKAFHDKISTHSHKNNIPEVKLNTSTSVVYLQQYYRMCHALICFSINFKNVAIPIKCISFQDDNSGTGFWGIWHFLKSPSLRSLVVSWKSTFFKTRSFQTLWTQNHHQQHMKKTNPTQGYHLGTLEESFKKSGFFFPLKPHPWAMPSAMPPS